MTTRFRDRTEAGQQLAQQLKTYANRPAVVLALPRGGVPIAYEIAQELNLPLDLCLVRKLGEPGHRENAIGAIAADGIRVLNYRVIRGLGISQQTLQTITAQEQQELERRDRAYRSHCPRVAVHDRTVILVDDGLATGATMRAAVMWVRSQQPNLLIIAVPIASKVAYQQLKAQVDRLVCLYIPNQLYAIGRWYDNFTQVTDRQVCTLLAGHSPSSHRENIKEATA
ncbi:phosphoribosyltransferase [Leptolyngbya cf. ectocarpi LEGE 11479]|uniref:Phosphoribosyltransferase n=1 Tax=Leptolyngbya cf. ectocarpi LEGE 11479 TaxID=1828722 RepID=A0A928ZX76_LEPEC|nr:phosphoribosyltransferase [Leptolyngbya ectocarpi]MBE9069161.1 phosphoribosyltransferase [Leptolyngbya cf. ectocarpi LEGE 11479]